MKGAFCTLLFLFLAGVASGGLEKYPGFVVSGGETARGTSRGGIRITYLGVNGYQFETAGHALLADPYFSRVGLGAAVFDQPIAPSPERIEEGFKHLQARADAILVTHAHFDHLLDVPELLRRTGARLCSGPTAVALAQSLGTPPRRCVTVQPGSVKRIGPWTIRVFAAQHDRLFGSVPFPGKARAPVKAPVKPSDWVTGEPLAFVIEAAGKRIYLDAGGLPGAPPDPAVGKVDLAILGVALSDSRQRFPATVRRLHPRYVLASHQDDFFQPFSHGFVFGKLTNFPEVVRTHENERLPGRLILMDYFQPWTLR